MTRLVACEEIGHELCSESVHVVDALSPGATRCTCGGLLAEDDHGRLTCMGCDTRWVQDKGRHVRGYFVRVEEPCSSGA